MTYGMPTKYGRQGHAPRCDCPDCNASFVDHNRRKHCDCLDCTYHREIHADAPPMVPHPQRNPYDNYYQSNIRPQETVKPKPEVKKVSGIHICEREGCEAFIRGEALSYVDLMPNTAPGTNRKVMELCPACIEDVYNLLQVAPISERARGYSKPYDPARSTVDDSLETATDEQVAANLFQRIMKQAQKQISGGTKVDEDGE